VSDGDIALYGATDGKPGVVIISGTGSIFVGVNRHGKRVMPEDGDRSRAMKAADRIARRALQMVARK
jgi:N-acetylglucosamine kinase-like BadF-type ATPase